MALSTTSSTTSCTPSELRRVRTSANSWLVGSCVTGIVGAGRSADFPASTLVEVSALAAPEILGEIEAIAHIGKGKR